MAYVLWVLALEKQAALGDRLPYYTLAVHRRPALHGVVLQRLALLLQEQPLELFRGDVEARLRLLGDVLRLLQRPFISCGKIFRLIDSNPKQSRAERV